MAVYASGHLVFVRDRTLLRRRSMTERFKRTATPFVLATTSATGLLEWVTQPWPHRRPVCWPTVPEWG